MKRKLLLGILILILMFAFSFTASAADDIKVVIDGENLSFDNPPVIQNGTTLVPMRAIFEALGAAVLWDSENRTVTGTKGQTTVLLTIDSSDAYINGKGTQLSVAAQILNGSTMVPLRFISESFDCDVQWDSATRTITISSTSSIPEPPSGNYTDISVTVEEANLYRIGEELPTIDFPRNLDDSLIVELTLEHEEIDNDAYKTLSFNINSYNGVVKIQGQRLDIPIEAGDTTTTYLAEVPIGTLIAYNADVDAYSFSIVDGSTNLYSGFLNLFYDSTEDEEFAEDMTVKSIKFWGGLTDDWIDYGDRTYYETFQGRFRSIGTEVIVSYPNINGYKVLPVTFVYNFPDGYSQTMTFDYYLEGNTGMFQSMLYFQYSSDNYPYGKYSVDVYIYDTYLTTGNFTIKKL